MKNNKFKLSFYLCVLCAVWVSGCTTNRVIEDVSASRYMIEPAGLPNRGILFVDHESMGRSGHGGSTLVEAANGDLLAFYSSVDGDVYLGGHGVGGWTEYRRSRDGGETWEDPVVFEYSKEIWDGDEYFSALVFSVERAANGNLVAILPRFKDEKWNKMGTPVYFLSHDHGASWNGPHVMDPSASVEEFSITYDGGFYCATTEILYVVGIGGVEAMCPGPHTLYASDDNGQSFRRLSKLPFPYTYTYGTGQVLEDGSIVVYAYPWIGSGGDDQAQTSARDTDEKNMPYVISRDGGYTWSSIKTAYFSKYLRNGQMSPRVGGYYFMHGRTGLYGSNPRNLVVYASKDGIHWDDGLILKSNSSRDADSYSANTVVRGHGDESEERLLIQSSVSYDGRFKVNLSHWWVRFTN